MGWDYVLSSKVCKSGGIVLDAIDANQSGVVWVYGMRN